MQFDDHDYTPIRKRLNVIPLELFDPTLDYINFPTTSRLRHLWNLLPLELTSRPTLALFKRKIHERLIR